VETATLDGIERCLARLLNLTNFCGVGVCENTGPGAAGALNRGPQGGRAAVGVMKKGVEVQWNSQPALAAFFSTKSKRINGSILSNVGASQISGPVQV
jgi:hypothetical protein